MDLSALARLVSLLEALGRGLSRFAGHMEIPEESWAFVGPCDAGV